MTGITGPCVRETMGVSVKAVSDVHSVRFITAVYFCNHTRAAIYYNTSRTSSVVFFIYITTGYANEVRFTGETTSNLH